MDVKTTFLNGMLTDDTTWRFCRSSEC
jgi:hypothetical protein